MDALIAKKRAEVMARLANMKLPGGVNTVPAPVPAPPAAAAASPLDTIAAIKARIQAKLSGQSTVVAPAQPTELHPMLRDDYKASARSGQAPMPRISSIKANQRKEQPKRLKIEHEAPASFTDPEKNPYFDPALGTQRTAEPHARRAGKQFQFARPGRYIEQAEKLRNEAKMEQLKVEIAARAEVARLEDEVLDANAIKFSEPPEVEWWDTPFVSNGMYPQGDVVPVESLITIYVQHPVPVEPPASILSMSSAPSQLMLTRKERKKVRRQRRIETQREHREKVMLGLLPPDEPKLRMSNFMRIMANQSVPDPTKLEAEVRRQMQARLDRHEADNQARKLTKEQRVAKNESKVESEEQRGVVAAVFRVDNLKYPQHRYKVSINAKQNHLTGVALVCEHLSVVVVEGPEKFVKAYKKLMLRRIDWVNGQVKLEAASSAGDGGQAEIDWSKNSCHMIWQGAIEQRRFTQFRLRDCPTEGYAKRVLGSAGCESYWQLAKQFDPSTAVASDLLL
ncbi:U4/U5/U6 small nuclear ribonucleoprotein prp3 [Coemansia aciculifera]|uniref:U4/U5/U6 small nuclear ribonucleoprotein prp3 n=1 Tax=Coemansia aciculifera TaxID=417176 RepID=A0A9W8IEJ0_9FUNG|nr:U4/U5/U6 small nuclear ribonucleoprotein prp3 [Coemansia aciculifera]KAJ2869168.1 U4/U5/U6 small nuclear ribonucleoprotein prp3 [Coemansia aciculifera]KAJ2880806.1 U4/U5/U6 small nuclear ribonucleoprotein prp3 [Coemansia aciculifera]